jgi:hypothetical protein
LFWSLLRDPPADPANPIAQASPTGKSFFSALFDAQKAVSNRTKITWKHQSGFSLQFYFNRIGFAPLVWGFPAKNRDGKGSRERLDFPFDFSLKAGVPEAFINEFGASLSSLVPLLGGGKRPNISITALSSGDSTRIIETIFSFAAKAAQK